MSPAIAFENLAEGDPRMNLVLLGSLQGAFNTEGVTQGGVLVAFMQ